MRPGRCRRGVRGSLATTGVVGEGRPRGGPTGNARSGTSDTKQELGNVVQLAQVFGMGQRLMLPEKLLDLWPNAHESFGAVRIKLLPGVAPDLCESILDHHAGPVRPVGRHGVE